MTADTVKIYVEVLDEGSPTIRPTQAAVLGNGLLKLLPAPDYNPEDENWAFPPGSVVRGEKKINQKKEILFAVAP
jgi:hypothetical protein